MMSKMAAAGNPRFMHAVPQDFCAIFNEDMSALYSLALLLTADHEMAQQCFLAALDHCLKGADVFPDRARSWSRRAIVKQAIQVVNPRPNGGESSVETWHDTVGDEIAEVRRRLMQLPAFTRFVFAMAVLERYSIPECATLLNCGARDVEQARIRALQLISGTGRDLQPATFTGNTGQEPRLMADIGAA